jgi:hypothetical protein
MRYLLNVVVCLLLFASAASAQESPAQSKRYLFVGFDGGLAWANGDGADLWESGATAAINVLYPFTSVFAGGARLGFVRWSLSEEGATAALLPAGAVPLQLDSEGKFEILALAINGRATKDAFIGRRLAAFVQVGGGVYHVRFSAETVLEYAQSSQSQVVIASASGSDYRGGLSGGAGLSFTFSRDSRLELYPAYSVIFEPGGSTEYLSLLVGFRVEFSPWDDD